MGKAGDFKRLIREGKTAEARTMLEEEKSKSKFAPDEIIQKTGEPAIFKRRRKLVIQDKDGTWKPKKPTSQ